MTIDPWLALFISTFIAFASFVLGVEQGEKKE